MRHRCNYCYYRGNGCRGRTPCEYYFPLEEEPDDSDIDSLIKAEKKEYYDEWLAYISEDYFPNYI